MYEEIIISYIIIDYVSLLHYKQYVIYNIETIMRPTLDSFTELNF